MPDFLLHRKQDICCGQDRTVQIHAQENQSFVFQMLHTHRYFTVWSRQAKCKNRKNWFGRVCR